MARHWLPNARLLTTLAAVLTLALIVACGTAAPEPAAPASQPAVPAQPAAQQQQPAAPAAEPAVPSQPAAPAQQQPGGAGSAAATGDSSAVPQETSPTIAPAGPQTTRQEYVVPTPVPQVQPEPAAVAD